MAPKAAPLPQVAGQLNLPVGDAWSLDINGSVSLIDSALNPGSSTLQGLMIVTFNLSSPNYTLSFGPSLAHTELATNYGIGVEKASSRLARVRCRTLLEERRDLLKRLLADVGDTRPLNRTTDHQ